MTHFCDICGNVLRLATPILGYCPDCETVCPVNVSPPVPVHVHQAPPQPAPARQETDELGSETECLECGGLEKKVTPIMAVCAVCGAIRSLVVKPVRDAAASKPCIVNSSWLSSNFGLEVCRPPCEPNSSHGSDCSKQGKGKVQWS